MIGSGGSSVLMYFGYFNKNLENDSSAHVAYGNTYIVALAVSYVSSWLRHKNPRITSIAEMIHGASGYMCFILACKNLNSMVMLF